MRKHAVRFVVLSVLGVGALALGTTFSRALDADSMWHETMTASTGACSPDSECLASAHCESPCSSIEAFDDRGTVATTAQFSAVGAPLNAALIVVTEKPPPRL